VTDVPKNAAKPVICGRPGGNSALDRVVGDKARERFVSRNLAGGQGLAVTGQEIMAELVREGEAAAG
jgi:hypothetical protein